MNRRTFLGTLAGALLAAPLAAEAQQAGKVWRIGSLNTSPIPVPDQNPIWDAFRYRLRELGYIEGQNLTIEYRTTGGPADRLPDLAVELIRLNVDVIVVPATQAALVAKQATRTIPIVLAAGVNPVETGLVKSLARPGGNLTGLSVSGGEVSGKRLELLREVIPKVSRVAVLLDPTNPAHAVFWKDTERAAEKLHLRLQRVTARAPEEIEAAFWAMAKARAEALVVFTEPMLYAQRDRLADLAARNRLPTINMIKGHAEAGDLIAYGPDYRDLYRRVAEIVDKILKGAKPADLPIEQPTKFELVINLKTAKALGLTIPQSLLLRADQVIE
jgi:putative tryptophan/tyrosine transport system substrate-binding protein